MTLNERIEIAHKLRAQGLNCSQCVAMAFPDIHNLPDEVIAKLSIGFGGGVGGQGEVCGVVSGMTIIEGFRSNGGAKDKITVYPRVSNLSEIFKSKHCSIICRELKGMTPPRPCNELILSGIEILHNFINETE